MRGGEERSDEWKVVSCKTSETSPKEARDEKSSLRSSCPLCLTLK